MHTHGYKIYVVNILHIKKKPIFCYQQISLTMLKRKLEVIERGGCEESFPSS
jgi:hypothetical protein